MATIPQLASLFDSTIKACLQQVNSAISGSTIVDESVWITCTIQHYYWMSCYFPHTFNVAYIVSSILSSYYYTLLVVGISVLASEMCTMNNQTLNGFVLLNVKWETLPAAAVGREMIN